MSTVDSVLRMSPPLQEPTFFILMALTGEPLHGYGLLRAVTELSDQRIKLSAGTLYPALDRLTQEGLIVVTREEVVGSRLRRYYELSEAGATRLAEEAARLTENAAKATRSLAARTRPAPSPLRARGATT
jgi:DNA-binding PadR family transcriptional regulator